MPTSCTICRRRKVRCDRTPGCCQRCSKLGFQCSYGTSPSTNDNAGVSTETEGFLTQAGLKRRRNARSCLHCKQAKAKCSGGSVCERCRARALSCYYHPTSPTATIMSSAAKDKSSTPKVYTPTIPEWLMCKSPPSQAKIREFIDIFFTRIHTVRCMGFIHVPTFMVRLRELENSPNEIPALVLIMCALAAPFLHAGYTVDSDEDPEADECFFHAGRGWADVAAQQALSSSGDIGIETLMTHVLLHDYFLRVGDYAKAVIISGMIARHSQVLQLNIEHDYDIMGRKTQASWAVKESRRRLVWACYLLDAFIECGIDQLRFISANDVQVQLPCLEDLFIRNTPCITELFSPGQLLPFARNLQDTNNSKANLDLRSFYIRTVGIRSRILRYVKHLQGDVPWQSGENSQSQSQFAILDRDLRDLESSIPDNFKMCAENTYLFKSCGRLNLYFAVHILIAQSFNDLYRIGVSQLVFPFHATKWIRENAPREFIQAAHRMCASKAVYIGSLLKDIWHCDKGSIVDVPFVQHVQVCSTVLVSSLISWTEPEPLLPEMSYQDYRDILESNVHILRYLKKFIKADLYFESANLALKRFTEVFTPMMTRYHQSTSPTTTTTAKTTNARSPRNTTSPAAGASTLERNNNPPQYSLEYILNPLGTYPMARKQAQDRHRPEEIEAVTNSGDSAGALGAAENATNNDDTFLNFPLEWMYEHSFMDDTGYPTFLEQFFQENIT